MFVNFEKKAIELTTAEMTEAMKYNSQAYKDLMGARRDNPDYRVVEIKTKKVRADLDRLDLKTIKAYVKANGNADQKAEFLRISTPTYTEDGLRIDAQPFFYIKKWFLAQFPAVKDAYAKREAEIKAINNAIDAKIEAAKSKADEKARAKAQAEAEEFLKVA